MVGRVYFSLLGTGGIAVRLLVDGIDEIRITDDTYCKFTFPLGWECSGPADMMVGKVGGREVVDFKMRCCPQKGVGFWT